MKKFWYGLLTGLAIALGTVAALLLNKLLRKDVSAACDWFVKTDTEIREPILKEIQVLDQAALAQSEALRTTIEDHTKEELIHAFKNMFRIPDADDGPGTNSPGPSGTSLN